MILDLVKCQMGSKEKYSTFYKNLFAFSQSESISVRQLWWLWLCVAIIIFLIQAYAVGSLPSIQQDEAQITDYGRLALDPYSDWSINWLLKDGKPLLLWSYLGPLLAEVGYRVIGAEGVGPRIVALFGGLVAATMALGWLTSRKVPLVAASLLSLAFLMDPLFVLSQRLARVDSWVIASCLASCWMLRIAVTKQKTYPWVMVAGGVAVTSLFIWPSALFLFPLISLELLHLIWLKRVIENNWRKTLLLGFTFVGGGVFFLVILLIPIWKNLFLFWEDVAKMITLNTKSSTSSQEKLFALFDLQHWLKLIKVLVKTFTPIFPMVALLSLFYRQKKELVFVVLLTLVLMFATLVYEFRVLYLLPYFMVMSGTIFTKIHEGAVKSFKINLGIATLFALIFWSAGISLFVRSYLAVQENGQTRTSLYQAARMSIGPGKHKVFLAFTYEMYFSGRSLGWELYTPYLLFSYDKQGNWKREHDFYPRDRFVELLTKMDYAIFPLSMVNEDISVQLDQGGLQRLGVLKVGYRDKKTNQLKLNDHKWNMFMWFLLGKRDYGPYLLYGRRGVALAFR